jgi:hypothetical protein
VTLKLFRRLPKMKTLQLAFAVAASGLLACNLAVADDAPAPTLRLQFRGTDLTLSGTAAPVQHRVFAIDNGHAAIVGADGKVEWEYPCHTDGHGSAVLGNGNVLLRIGTATIAEISPEKKIVWQYESKPQPGYKGHIEVHAFQRLPDGLTMIAEGGNSRIIEVDSSGKIVHEMPLVIKHPNPHVDTRMVHKLDNGHYLVCQGGDSKVCEYDGDGKVVWSYTLDLGGRPASPGHGVEGHGTEPYDALRLPSGNTLIAAGNGNRVIEVSPAGKIVWSVEQHELPGITLAWVTSLEVLPSGNLIFGNCHAGPANPQLIEVTRDKHVVWTMKNFKTFGNATATAQVLDVPGNVLR